MQKFLTLPFSKSELTKNLEEMPHEDFEYALYHITEWYIYHPGIHGYALHAWVDRYLPYGRAVYAPCDGYAMASYNYQRAVNKQGEYRTIDGKRISYGLGFCVQIYNPRSTLFVLLGHLSYLSNGIPYTDPKRTTTDEWYDMRSASGFQFSQELITKINDVPRCKAIRRWDYIGDVGLSWLRITNEFPTEVEAPWKRLRQDPVYYTLPHIHMNIFPRDESGKKMTPLDPYDIYSTSEEYPTHFNWITELWTNHLFVTWEDGLPMYTDEYFE